MIPVDVTVSALLPWPDRSDRARAHRVFVKRVMLVAVPREGEAMRVHTAEGSLILVVHGTPTIGSESVEIHVNQAFVSDVDHQRLLAAGFTEVPDAS